jgi:putative ABC transport system permease protein
MRGAPGIMSAAAVSTLPLAGSRQMKPVTLESVAVGPEQTFVKAAGHVAVTPGYFETMGIPIVAGRAFTGLDDGRTEGVAIINRSGAQRYWPEGEAVGKRLRYGGYDSDDPWLTIIGVVGDVRHEGLEGDVRFQVYRPFAQFPRSYLALVARTRGDALAATAAVQNAIWQVDPDQAVFSVRSMDEVIASHFGAPKIYTELLGVFAAIALALAAVGLYGVMSNVVSRRTHEIGVRKALGARTPDILRLVFRQSLLMVMLGILGGLGLSLIMGRMFEGLMYGVSPTDQAAFLVVSAVLISAALLACYVPARRATRVDPMVALRCE